MIQTLTYGVDVSWPELVDFLDEKYLELLCKRLHVSRDEISRVPFILSSGRNDAISFLTLLKLISRCCMLDEAYLCECNIEVARAEIDDMNRTKDYNFWRISYAFSAGRYHSIMFFVMVVCRMYFQGVKMHELRYFQEIISLSDDLEILWLEKCDCIVNKRFVGMKL